MLVDHRVVKQNVAPGAEHDLRPHLLPGLARREMIDFEKVTHFVVHQALQVVGQVRARVIHLSAYQEPPIKLRGQFHGFSLHKSQSSQLFNFWDYYKNRR